jgi:hypothetical protein
MSAISLNSLSDSPYLAANDFSEGFQFPPRAISSIVISELPIPGKKTVKKMAMFNDTGKGWAMGKNRAREIAALIGGPNNNIGVDWIGVSIVLHIIKGVRRPDGTYGNAIRVTSATRPSTSQTEQQTTAQKAS